MTLRKLIGILWLDSVVMVVFSIIFIVPFVFIVLTAAKSQSESALLEFTLPEKFLLKENIKEVIEFRDRRVLLALKNSTILTIGSVALIVIIGSFLGFVIQRRANRLASIVSTLLLIGLIVPPAVVPTIYLLQKIGLYKTLISLVLIEVAIQLPFATLIFRTFVASIPREIDEAAIIDGANPFQLFAHIIFPLLRPASVTVAVISAVFIYNDFTLPLYFLPGEDNVTAQLTLYSFRSQFNTQWNLLFANVIIITIPPLIMYIFFQRQIVAGLTAGSVKG
ncbi:MAG: carbohydrate ABC transporter permease [Anaerolineae bacterium]|nr:MAG: carbohydrate ABC transporter permease [Anaerolineae bacterium]MCL4876313.1 carbohydrate ABC transporter permease [Anaerolineae bacterium]